MWIRSQDKLFLVEAKRILILSPNAYRKKFEIVNYVSEISDAELGTFADYDSLGEYESKKRAIEVLDDIQENINVLKYDKVYKSHNEKMYAQGRYVYQMPEK